jgi:hypothetical protein
VRLNIEAVGEGAVKVAEFREFVSMRSSVEAGDPPEGAEEIADGEPSAENQAKVRREQVSTTAFHEMEHQSKVTGGGRVRVWVGVRARCGIGRGVGAPGCDLDPGHRCCVGKSLGLRSSIAPPLPTYLKLAKCTVVEVIDSHATYITSP